MPIYAYRCESCGFGKDVLQKMSDAPLTQCPECGADTFRKQVTAAGFQLKGSGWYVTDFRGGNSASNSDKSADKSANKTGTADSAAPAQAEGGKSNASDSAAGATGSASGSATAVPAAKPAASGGTSGT